MFNINLTLGTPPQTDLAVTNLWLDPETPILDGDLVKVTAVVINNGSEEAHEFKVRFMDGIGERNTSEIVFNETTIPLLSAGCSTIITTTWNASSGYHTLSVFVDSIADLNDLNNQNSTSVYVNKARDFVVSTVSLSYTGSNESCDLNTLFLGDKVTINASLEIINLANHSGKVAVGLYLNEALVNVTSVVFDVGNETYHAPFNWQIDTAGNYNLIVCADYNNIIS
jgi:subtilase family serine protease